MKIRFPRLSHPSWFVSLFILLTGFKTADDLFEISKNLELFNAVYKEVQRNYVDDVSPGELMRKGIDAMLGNLDPYTNYFSEAQAEDALMDRQGEYAGVGCQIKIKDQFPVVTEVFGGFAFAKSDVRPGDVLLEINGVSMKNKNTEQVGVFLRGAVKTALELKLKRQNESLVKSILREEIRQKNVPFYGMVNNQVGYIKLEQFGQNASGEVKTALLELKKNTGFQSLILDLRNNGGGLLNEAVNIVGLFVPQNTLVVTMKGKNKQFFQEWKTQQAPVDLNMKVVVLVNHRSASASEVVSGSLQDLDRAVIIGRNSYGKGLVQQTFPLPYRSQVKITIAKYYTPSGRCIQLLDYSKRNPDGSVAKVPDSLRKVFTTTNGRKVLDGGGVKPDIMVDEFNGKSVVKLLEEQDIIFDFANEFRNEQSSIPSASSFKLPQEKWNKFIDKAAKSLAESSYEKLVQNMGKSIGDEDAAYSLIRETVGIEKLQQVWNSKIKEVENALKFKLEQEICKRYYYENALFETGFSSDPDILKSVEILANESAYLRVFKP